MGVVWCGGWVGGEWVCACVHVPVIVSCEGVGGVWMWCHKKPLNAETYPGLSL